MVTKERLAGALSNLIQRGGTPIRFQYFEYLYDDNTYDDSVVLTQSGGDHWTSGIIFPLSNEPGHSDRAESRPG